MEGEMEKATHRQPATSKIWGCLALSQLGRYKVTFHARKIFKFFNSPADNDESKILEPTAVGLSIIF